MLLSTLPRHYSPTYRLDIDGMRAIAVLSGIFFHLFPNRVKGGFVGVDMFFVISGYLISCHIFRSLFQNEFSFLEFYAKRIKRIFPALFVVLIALCVAGWYFLLSDEY